jgi:hypothetical protein
MTVQKKDQTTRRRWLALDKPACRRLRAFLVCACTLVLLSLLPSLLPRSGSGNVPAVSEALGGRGEIALGDAVPDETGYYCASLFSVLSQFHFYADINKVIPEIGVPPDYATGQSDKRSGVLTTSAQDDLAGLFPAYDEHKKQDLFRYDSPYKTARHERLCASEKNGRTALISLLDTFYGYNRQTGENGTPVNKTTDKSPIIDPVKWVTDAITGFWDNLWRQVVDFFQHQIIDWVNSLGFIWMTPAALSYKNPMVLSGAAWTLLALDGYIALLLVIGGSQVLLNRSLGLEERESVLAVAMRVILTALVANTGFFLFLPSMVELSNSLGMGIMGALMSAASGEVSLPLGAINWVEQPISWGLFILLYFFTSLLLIAVEAVRLAVLDVTIMLSPLWIMALANEYSRAWGRFGALTFFSALLMQPIQVACVSLGSALIANFGHLNPNDPAICQRMSASAHEACVAHLGHASLSGSMNIIVLVLGIATLYVAIKIPGMLFSNALRASVGSVNRDIGQVARAAMSVVFVQKQLNK